MVDSNVERLLCFDRVVACGLSVVKEFSCDVMVDAAGEESGWLGRDLPMYGLFEGVHADGREGLEDLDLR